MSGWCYALARFSSLVWAIGTDPAIGGVNKGSGCAVPAGAAPGRVG
jgi:hypothetical protein